MRQPAGRRPTDWSPLGDADPVPGDPYEVAVLGRRFQATAQEIAGAAQRLRTMCSDVLAVPDGWYRITLEPGAREPAIANIIDRQFHGIDNARHPKGQAREQLLRVAQHAYGNGGMELYVSLQTAGGFPLPASLVVTLAPPHDDPAVVVTPERLAETLGNNFGQVALVDLPIGRAVRVRRRAEATILDVYVPVPESGAYLVLSFSTPLDALADAMIGLFDSIASTLRWIR